MARLNVVCATQPGPNPGMASVDLALQALVRRHGLKADVAFHQLYTTNELLDSRQDAAAREPLLRRQALPFEYVCSRAEPERVWDADAVVFWGDFLHMEHYARTIAQRLVRIGAAADEAQGRAQALDYFFLRRAPAAALGRTLAFGGTLVFDRGPEASGDDYAQAFARFMRGARGVWMRDVYSALKVARARGTEAAPALGTDCALLLRPDDFAELPRSAWTADAGAGRDAVGMFFGRSPIPLEKLAGFGQDLARRLDAKPHWIPWGTAHSFPAMRYQVREPEPDTPPLLGDLLELIRRYRLVITDTYHLCVNAWNLGVPAICVGQGVVRAPNNVNSGWAFAWRDKREVFYAMHDALECSVHAQELGPAPWRERRLAQLVELLGQRGRAAAVVERVRGQARAAEAAVVEALKALLR